MSGREVYQASPETCVRIARQSLHEALDHLGEGRDWGEAEALVRNALVWLPSWLESEWDDRMTAWLERDGVGR